MARSSRTSGNSDIASGVEDLKAGVEVVMKETGVQKMHFSGASSGALRAAAYAKDEPERADRLILCAMTYKGTGAPTLTNRADRSTTTERTTRARAGSIDIENSFSTRDKQGVRRSRLAQGARRPRLEVRRPGAERHLSRHGREPAIGSTRKNAFTGDVGTGRIRRHRHGRGPRPISTISCPMATAR